MTVVCCWRFATRLAADNTLVTSAGWTVLSEGVRRNLNLALIHLYGMDLAKGDDTLPDDVVNCNNSYSNEAVLTYYRARAQARMRRIRRRVAAVAVLRTAWHCGKGRPARGIAADATQSTRAAELAHMVQLRRMCRVREGREEVVEPFGRCVVAYL